MSEYIKREDVLKLIDTGYLISNSNYNKETKLINELPSADVEPVRHGRWLRVGQSYIDPNKFLCFECSICRCTLDNHIKVEQNYCPNCGARMKGENE